MQRKSGPLASGNRPLIQNRRHFDLRPLGPIDRLGQFDPTVVKYGGYASHIWLLSLSATAELYHPRRRANDSSYYRSLPCRERACTWVLGPPSRCRETFV